MAILWHVLQNLRLSSVFKLGTLSICFAQMQTVRYCFCAQKPTNTAACSWFKIKSRGDIFRPEFGTAASVTFSEQLNCWHLSNTTLD